jgi:NAD(P)-dependent dehydrogenase (short-subunit alcohol dehydrogenase family)
MAHALILCLCETAEQPATGIPKHMKPDLSAGRPYYGFTSYGQSKTANILHAVSLNERLGKKGIRAFAVHPGCEIPYIATLRDLS